MKNQIQFLNTKDKIRHFRPKVWVLSGSSVQGISQPKRTLTPEEAAVRIVRRFGSSVATLAD